MSSTARKHSPTTTAFYAQAVASFAISLGAVGLGVAYLPVNGWVRAFLALGLLFTVTSAFTLAKCIRDRQEETYVVSGWTRRDWKNCSPSTTRTGWNRSDRRQLTTRAFTTFPEVACE